MRTVDKSNPNIPQKPAESIHCLRGRVHQRMVKEYSTSQGYFYTKTIDDLI